MICKIAQGHRHRALMATHNCCAEWGHCYYTEWFYDSSVIIGHDMYALFACRHLRLSVRHMIE